MMIRIASALASLIAVCCAQAGVQPPSLAMQGAPGDLLGSSVAVVGDLDGDGLPDLAVGATQASPYAGGGPGFVRFVSASTGSVIRQVNGVSAGDAFGGPLARVADVDGDGFDDVVVGALGAGALVSAHLWSGRAYVVSGGSGSIISTITEIAPGDRHGWSVAGLGDVNGDGWPEVAIGAPGAIPQLATIPGYNTAGTVGVADGRTGTILMTATDGIPGRCFGHSVVGLGDVDGDGVEELAIGAPYYAGPYWTGSVVIVNALTGLTLRTLVPPTNATDSFGASLAALDDVDGDGVRDLAIIGSGTNPSLAAPVGVGSVFVYSGATGALIWQRFGYAARDVAAVGDVSGDGVPDVAVGVHRVAGISAPGGAVQVLDGATGAEIARAFSTTGASVYAPALAGLGDVTGDGLGDLVLGTPNVGTLEQGLVEVRALDNARVYGATGLPPQTITLGWLPTSLVSGVVQASGAPSNAMGLLGLAAAAAQIPLPGGGEFLVDPSMLLIPPIAFTFDPSGNASILSTTLVVPGSGGTSVFAQVLALAPPSMPNAFALSNGLEVVLVN